MARYIKANPLVAEYLQLKGDRNTVSDGNYLLWQADMLKFGPLTQLQETLALIGGISLTPHEAKQEQDGTVVRSLPLATDSRFKTATYESTESETEEAETVETEATDTATDGEATTNESEEAQA